MLSFIRAMLAGFLLITSAVASAQLKNGEYHATLNGVKHWYRIAGAEHRTTPLVVIHGGPGGSIYTFEHSMGPRLERFATVVYYDQRGSGRSDAPTDDGAYAIDLLVSDLEMLRHELKVEKLTPLGFSFGAQLALEYAIRYPAAVERLILQSASNGDQARIARYQAYGFALHAVGPRREKLEALAVAPIPNASEHINKIWDGATQEDVSRFLFQSSAAWELNNRLNAEARKHGSRPNSGKMAKVIFSAPPRKPSLTSELNKIAAPTLVMVGLYDRNIGVDMNREITQAIPDSKLVTFERSAHFPDLEEPEKYAETVRDFLDKR